MRRREFVSVSALSALQLYAMGCTPGRSPEGAPAKTRVALTKQPAGTEPGRIPGFGPLIAQTDGLLELPEGFRYVAVQRSQQLMKDGHRVPFQPDGMACFVDAQGRYVLLRNHELGDRAFMEKYGFAQAGDGQTVPAPAYNPKAFGGVVKVVVDPAQLKRDLVHGGGMPSTSVIDSRFVLSGTLANCAGGVLDGGWVTCEESTVEGHGYAFMTRPTDTGLVAPRRITPWGRFKREAISHDPAGGAVYMTEDHREACFYRFVPKDKGQPMGEGVLQALKVHDVSDTSPYPDRRSGVVATQRWPNGTEWKASWVDIDDPQAVSQPCHVQGRIKGASRFYRCEGISRSGSSIWFSASLGGAVGAGQIFEYRPDPKAPGEGTLVLSYEVADRSIVSCPDNLLVTPWGELLMAEDNYTAGGGSTHQHLRVMTQTGVIYDLARNRRNFPEKEKAGAEFTGACFSPDGKVLFVNLQKPEHLTVAIVGPWPTLG